MLSLALLVTNALLVSAAIKEDEITSLPGWEGALPSRQYSGYLPVNEEKSRFLHYWFVESEGSPSTDPLVLWLNGGPGCSSLDGYFYEQGPLHFESNDPSIPNPKLVRNPNTWCKMANMIFLESPVGVGYSYSTKGESDLATNDTRTAEENLRFLDAFFAAYPEYGGNRDFYISGESYAGIYIPMLVDAIRIQNEKSPSMRINLKGFLVGNGCTGNKVGVCADGNPYRIPFMYGHGLISEETNVKLLEACGPHYNGTAFTCREELQSAVSRAGLINIYDIYSPCVNNFDDENRVLPVLLRDDDVVKRVGLTDCIDAGVATVYLNSEEVRKALHMMPEADIGKWKMCKMFGYERTIDSVLTVYPTLIRTYRTLIYNGNVDACVPYTDNEEWTSSLGFSIKEPWRPWLVDEQVAGYVTTYDENGFTFLTVSGAGHMVPQYRPVQAYAMFERFIKNQEF